MTLASEDPGSSYPATTDLEELVEGVDAILWAADPDTLQFHYVSKGAERILGYPTTEWLERPDFWASILHPADRDRCVAFCRQQIALGFDHEFRYRAITADARVVWLRDNVRVEVDGSGTAVKLHGVMFDVTDRQARAAQQAAVAHFGNQALSSSWPELLREAVRVITETFVGVVMEILETDGDGEILPVAASWDFPVGIQPGGLVDDPRSWASFVFAASGPVVFEDLASETEFGPDERLAGLGVASGIGVAIGGPDGRARGLIGVYSVTPRNFSLDEAHFLGSIAAILATAASRAEIERELERRESQLATAQDIAGLGSWEWIPDSDKVWWSEELFEVHGQDPKSFEPSFEAFVSIVAREDREHVIAGIEGSLQTRDDLEFDYVFMRSDGVRRIGHALARWVSNAEGAFDRLVGTVQDITETKEAALRVRESEQRLRAIFDNAGLGIATVTPRGRVREANRALHALLGYPEGDLRGRHFIELAHPDDAEADQILFQELLDGRREEYTVERRFIRADGREVWGLLTATVVRDQRGTPTMAVGMVQDITLRKQAIEDVVESRAALAEKSDQLVRLTRRLVEAQEMERRNIAHDLHDEVGQILTGLKLTLEAAPASEPASGVAGRALPLVEDLISLIRDMTLALRPPMLDDLGLLPTLRWHIVRYEHSTDVAVRFSHSGIDRRFGPDVETAAYRVIQEALTNVARHASSEAALVRVQATDGRLCVEVSDEGIGFDGGDLDPSTHGVLGMRERLTSLGGSFSLDSAPGRGTVLRAELPIDGAG